MAIFDLGQAVAGIGQAVSGIRAFLVGPHAPQFQQTPTTTATTVFLAGLAGATFALYSLGGSCCLPLQDASLWHDVAAIPGHAVNGAAVPRHAPHDTIVPWRAGNRPSSHPSTTDVAPPAPIHRWDLL